MGKNKINKDESMILRAKEGDGEAMENLLNSFKPYIIKRATGVYLKGYEMDDLIQIGYMYVINCIEKYKIGSNSFTTYVVRAIDNGFNNEIRKRAKWNYEYSIDKSVDEEISVMDFIPCDINIEDDYLEKEEKEIVYKLIKELPKDYGHVIEEVFINECAIGDYAEKYNLTYSAVVKRKNRALKKLRERIKNSEL